MEDDLKTCEFPDFGPDDDTEEMEPREYRKAYEQSKIEFPDWKLLPELPDGFYDLAQSVKK